MTKASDFPPGWVPGLGWECAWKHDDAGKRVASVHAYGKRPEDGWFGCLGDSVPVDQRFSVKLPTAADAMAWVDLRVTGDA